MVSIVALCEDSLCYVHNKTILIIIENYWELLWIILNC